MPQGQININVQDGQLGIVAGSSAKIALVLGYCSAVSSFSPYPAVMSFSQPADIPGTAGYGAGPEAAALILASGASQVLLLPVQQSAAGSTGTFTDVVASGSTGTVSIASGTPYDAYKLKIKVVNAPIVGSNPGALVSAGSVAVQVSLDGGLNYGDYTLVPTSGVLALTRAAGAVLGDTGLSLQFSVGTTYFNVGDTFSATCTPPEFTGTQLTAAFNAALADSHLYSLVDVAGVASSSANAEAMYASLVSAAAAFTAAFRYARIFMSTPADTDANVFSAWASTADNARIFVCATTDFVFSPLLGSVIERGHSDPLVARLVNINPSHSPGDADDGPLTNVVSSSRNEFASPGAVDQRFATTTSVIGRAGVYSDGQCTAHIHSTSDYSNVMNCRVMDLVCTALVQAALHFQNQTVRLSANGQIAPFDVAKINQYVRAKILAAAGTEISGCTVSVYATDNILSTQTLRAQISILPFGYFKNITFTVGFVNPALQAA